MCSRIVYSDESLNVVTLCGEKKLEKAEFIAA